jgi:hypothetical protein
MINVPTEITKDFATQKPTQRTDAETCDLRHLHSSPHIHEKRQIEQVSKTLFNNDHASWPNLSNRAKTKAAHLSEATWKMDEGGGEVEEIKA